MCVDAMATKGSFEDVRPCSCRRMKCTKWRLRKCFHDEGEKLLKKWRVDSVRATARKYRLHGRTRKACDKQTYWRCSLSLYDKAQNFTRPVKFESHGGMVSSGTMAPDNTTQYLMQIVYQDLLSDCDKSMSSPDGHVAIDLSGHEQTWGIYDDSSSPKSVYTSLDRVYENTVEFQRRDFEEMFQIYSGSS